MFIYKNLVKLLNLIINIIFFAQIVLMAVIFLTAAYWFFNLIQSNLFDFAEPVALWVIEFVKFVCGKEIILSGTNIDGSLLFFDIIALIFIFLITTIKGFLYKLVDKFEYAITVKRRRTEQKVNAQLEIETNEIIKNYKKAAVVIEFEAHNRQVDKFWGGDPEKDVQKNTEEAIETLFNQVKSLSGCTFTKTDNRVVIVINNFDRIDRVLIFLEETINEIKSNMAKNNWKLISYLVVDAFCDKGDFKHDVYPCMEKLLELKQQNEIICYGNFSLRHDLLEKQMYYLVVLKGDYAMGDDFGNHTIYTLVKKSEQTC